MAIKLAETLETIAVKTDDLAEMKSAMELNGGTIIHSEIDDENPEWTDAAYTSNSLISSRLKGRIKTVRAPGRLASTTWIGKKN